MWTDFQNSFTNCFVRKFSIRVIYTSQRFLHHLQYVADEIRKSKNVIDFDSIYNKHYIEKLHTVYLKLYKPKL